MANPRSNLTYHRCRPHDAIPLRDLATACYTPYYRDLWEPGGMQAYLDSIYEPVSLAAELADPNLRFEIAYLDGHPVGFSKYHFRCDRADTPNAGYLERVYVAPSVMGEGIGSRLIDRMIDAARADGRDWIWLQAMARANKPLERYRLLGFEECAQSRLAIPRVQSAAAEMIVMRLALNAR